MGGGNGGTSGVRGYAFLQRAREGGGCGAVRNRARRRRARDPGTARHFLGWACRLCGRSGRPCLGIRLEPVLAAWACGGFSVEWGCVRLVRGTDRGWRPVLTETIRATGVAPPCSTAPIGAGGNGWAKEAFHQLRSISPLGPSTRRSLRCGPGHDCHPRNPKTIASGELWTASVISAFD